MHLLIRADASISIGTGHVMRCLALAQACLAAGWEVTFLMGEGSPPLAQRVAEEGVAVIEQPLPWGTLADAQQTIALVNQIEADWVVVDGYHFGADYQKWLKEANLRVLAVDDYGHATHYWADIVLNQNITASEELYTSRETYTKLLLGTRYVLLRKEFWPWRSWQRQIPPVASKILVTLGGSDPDNVTLKVILALQKAAIENLEAVVIVGGSNPHYQQLLDAVKGWEGKINLRQNVSNMPELMAWADMAITAGGSTCWEMAFMGLPCLLIPIADNQKQCAKRLQEIGAFEVLDKIDAEMIDELIDKTRSIHQSRYRQDVLSKRSKNLLDKNLDHEIIDFLNIKLINC